MQETNQALKFLIHFLGDIAQPLHTEHLASGGNGINVTWNGNIKKLHGVWDTEIPDRIAGGNDSLAIVRLTTALTAKINSGFWPNSTHWLDSTDLRRVEECALVWATESNAFICGFVLKEPVERRELNGTYFDGAKPIIEEQIAKGGVRLAAWINKLAEAASAREEEQQIELDL